MKYCIPCGAEGQPVEATMVLDGDPVCNAHGAKLGAPVAARFEDLCSRGCGKPIHRGGCKGVKRKQAHLPHQETQQSMDVLKARIITHDQIPKQPVAIRRRGRAGQLWDDFLRLNAGQVLEVECRDLRHVGTTARALAAKTRKAGIRLGEERQTKFYYCWKESTTP